MGFVGQADNYQAGCDAGSKATYNEMMLHLRARRDRYLKSNQVVKANIIDDLMTELSETFTGGR